jgi:hypothetical protein
MWASKAKIGQRRRLGRRQTDGFGLRWWPLPNRWHLTHQNVAQLLLSYFDSTVSTSINGVVVTWVVAIRVNKLDPPGVRFPLNAFLQIFLVSTSLQCPFHNDPNVMVSQIYLYQVGCACNGGQK